MGKLYKVRVYSRQHAILIQQHLFSLGYSWRFGGLKDIPDNAKWIRMDQSMKLVWTKLDNIDGVEVFFPIEPYYEIY